MGSGVNNGGIKTQTRIVSYLKYSRILNDDKILVCVFYIVLKLEYYGQQIAAGSRATSDSKQCYILQQY